MAAHDPHLGGVADDLLLVRSPYTNQFNHHPGQLMMQYGRGTFGLSTMGSWLTYGLGSESENLPGYVVLTGGRAWRASVNVQAPHVSDVLRPISA